VGIAAAAVVGVGGYLAYKEVYAPPSPGAPTVSLGAVLSLTGASAAFGQGVEFGHRQAVDDINAQGGIDVGGKKLSITYTPYDDASEASQASLLASQAILTDKVDMLVQGVGTPVTTNPISAAADRYGVPWIGGSPWESWWAGGPYKYAWSILFRISTAPSGFPRGYTITDNYIGLTNEYKDQTNGNVAVLATNDSDGAGWYDRFPQILQNAGYNIVSPQEVPMGTTDYSAMINTWKNTPCDILWGNLPAPDFGNFWMQSADLGFRPKMVLVGRAPLFYQDISTWRASVSNLPLGVCTEVWWDPSWGFKGIGNTTSQSLAGAWTSQTSTPVNRAIGFGYAAVQIAADAIVRAGTLDKDAVNTAIGETNDSFMTGPVKFFSDTHDSPAPVTMKQWQPGSGSQPSWIDPIIYSIIPSFPTTGQTTFPLPPWQ
jgi:branched-chain amino acid transport system substrate-binding protein